MKTTLLAGSFVVIESSVPSPPHKNIYWRPFTFFTFISKRNPKGGGGYSNYTQLNTYAQNIISCPYSY